LFDVGVVVFGVSTTAGEGQHFFHVGHLGQKTGRALALAQRNGISFSKTPDLLGLSGASPSHCLVPAFRPLPGYGPDPARDQCARSADFVLVSHEAEDHCAADLIFGNPLIFRSVMAVGLNRANGIPFYGVALQKDSSGQGMANTAFTLTFDGVKFCYLGQINMPLLAQEKQQLGHADVVFLPVGLQTLSVGDFNQIVKDLGATMVIPINYQTDLSGIVPLRTLDEYLSVTKFPVRKVNSDEIIVNRGMLPTEPTIYLLKSPTEAAPAQTQQSQ